MKEIPEKDWKHFKSLIDLILNRFSKETLSKIHQLIINKEVESKHEKYIMIFEYIMERDEEIGNTVNNLRRSNVKEKIAAIYRMGFIKPQEFEKFTDETKDFVNSYLSSTDSQ